MLKTDLQLQSVDGMYSLSGVTTDPAERLGGRVLVQMLSLQRGDRGSRIYTRSRQGMVATNARVVNTFALTTARMLTFLRRYQEDVRPRQVNLRKFSVDSDGVLALSYKVLGTEGSIEQTVEV